MKVLLKSSIDHTQIKEKKIRHDVNFIHGHVIISIKKKKKKKHLKPNLNPCRCVDCNFAMDTIFSTTC